MGHVRRTTSVERKLEPISDSTASDLLSAARAMSPAAWETLSGRYSRLVVFWIHKSGVAPQSVPDVLQAVMLKVAAYLPTFEKDGKKASFRRWLRTITNSQVAEFQRRDGRQTVADGGSDALNRMLALPAPLDPSSAAELAKEGRLDDLLEQVKTECPSTTWQAFWLTTVESQTSSEVAEELGITANAVRLAKARVLRRLRERAIERESAPG